MNDLVIGVRAMVLNATFKNISINRGGQLYCWRKLE